MKGSLVALLLVSMAVVLTFGAQPQILKFATIEDVDNLDPHVTMANTSLRLVYVMYDGLVQVGPDPTRVYPMLATSWTVSENGLTWTFYLRNDVYFKDGTHFDSSVAKFSFERLLGIGLGPSSSYKVIDKITADEPYVLQFHLKHPCAPFLWMMAAAYARIVPPSVMEHEKEGDWGKAWLAEHDLGSGPFQLKSWVKGQRLVLEANKNYWGGSPKLDQLIVQIIKEPATLKMELLSGNVDIAEGILTSDLDALVASKDVRVFRGPSFTMHALFFDTQHPPFNDKRCRKAVAYAIDYRAITEGVLKGWAVHFEGYPIPDGMWGKSEKVPLYERDLEKARELLAEAGYPEGFTTTLTLAPVHNYPIVATVIQSNLRDIGIKAKLEQYSWPTYLQMAVSHEVKLGIMSSTPDYPDPDQLLWLLLHTDGGFNISNYSNEEVDRLIEEGRRLTDQGERAKVYQELGLILHEEAPYVSLYQDVFYLPMRTWVKGYYFNPGMAYMVPFQKMWVEK